MGERSVCIPASAQSILDLFNFFLIQMRLLRNELTCFLPFKAQNRDTRVIKAQHTHRFEKSVFPALSIHGFALIFCSHLSLCEFSRAESCLFKLQIICCCVPTGYFFYLKHLWESVMYDSPLHCLQN